MARGMFYRVPTQREGVTMQVETLTDPGSGLNIGEAEIRGLHVDSGTGPAWDYAKSLSELIGVQVTRGGSESSTR